MPRYYFHVFNDIDTHDNEGQELADEQEAREQAVNECRVLAAESVRSGHLDLAHRIEVKGEDDAIVLTVTFGQAVRILGR